MDLASKPETYIPPEPRPWHSPRACHQNTGGEANVSSAINWDIEKDTALESFVKSFPTSLNAPYLPSKEAPLCPQGWPDSKGVSGKLLPIIPLNSQEETRIKVNEKPCQLLVINQGDTLFLIPHLTLEVAVGILGKPAETREGWKFLRESAPLPGAQEGEEVKISYCSSLWKSKSLGYWPCVSQGELLFSDARFVS